MWCLRFGPIGWGTPVRWQPQAPARAEIRVAQTSLTSESSPSTTAGMLSKRHRRGVVARPQRSLERLRQANPGRAEAGSQGTQGTLVLTPFIDHL
jgi:hypothetical protein